VLFRLLVALRRGTLRFFDMDGMLVMGFYQKLETLSLAQQIQQIHRCDDGQLLQCMLFPWNVDMAVIETALQRFSGLRGLLRAPRAMVCEALGLEAAGFLHLQAAKELNKRVCLERLQRTHALTSPALTRQFLLQALADKPCEIFALLLLDAQHRVIEFCEMAQGTINAATVYPREVVQKVLDWQAAAVILVHNHPSGVPEPSVADQNMTERLTQALRLIDVRVLDHIVVGATCVCSFAERGLIR
jgi:DNA repair protein RadC